MSSPYTMSERDKEILRTQRLFLLNNILPSADLLGYLHSTEILTEDMMEEIEVEKLKKSKIGKLLDILKRRGPNAFREFVCGLMESQQPHAAKSLDADCAKEWEAKHHKSMPPPSRKSPTRRPSHDIKTQLSAMGQVTGGSDDDEVLLTMNVTPVDEADTRIAKLLGDPTVYPMHSKPRGTAIIINNSYFVSSPPRDGAGVDSTNLCTFWDNLDFTTALETDLTAEEIKTVIRKQSCKKEHWDAQCLVVFVLSHGAQGYVYGIDGRKVSIEDDIVAPFYAQNCEALANKPKLFFIQACQGDSVTEGVSPEDESEVDASVIPSSGNDMKHVAEAMRSLQIQDTEETVPHLSQSHEKSDVVLAYSTVPGYRSWRRSDLGSWFVRAIIQVFSKEAHQEDLLSLLVKVRQKVAENFTNHTDQRFIQLTRTDETTRKKIFFFPGYWLQSRGHRA